jgi:ammonia channel protein AmtB
VIAVGLFASPEPCTGLEIRGLFRGGGWYALGVQALGATAISAFSVLSVLGTLFVCHTLGKLNGHLAFLTLRPSKARLAACPLAVSLPACPCR